MSTGSCIVRCARRNMGRTAVGFLASLILVGCGGGGAGDSGGTSGNPPPPPPPPPAISVSGGGIKGPLARAPLAFYEFDAGSSDFQAYSAAAIGVTDDQAAFDGVLVPAPNPPYFLVFTANQNTIDLTTGMAPVISRMKTVVTEDMLSEGYPIYATPLTTIAVELAIANAMSTEPPYDFYKHPNLVDNFLIALPIAARQVTSSLGFGLPGDVDIFRTWPVVGGDSDQVVLQATAEYRVAVEALSTLAYEIAQDVGGGTTADDVLSALAADLGDGIIDGVAVGGGTVALLGPAQRAILENADPGSLTIPNSSTLVDEVEALLASEATSIGATADTTALSNGSIQVVVEPAQLNPDRDGDGVLNAVDAYPDDPTRDTDTDGDGTADDVYFWDGIRRTGVDSLASDPDDDNDGLSDADELMLTGTDPLLADTDSDGLLDSIEVAALGSPVEIVYGEYAGTYSGSGTDPLSADSDSDGLLDGVEVATAGSTLVIASGPNAGSYTGTGTNPAQADSDSDGLNDGAEVNLGSNPLVTDSDGDGLNDGADNCPAVANAGQADDNGDGVGNLCSSDLNGVWKMNLLTTGLTWNGCEAGLLNSTRAHYFSVTQDAAGNLLATDQHGQVLTGTLTPGSNDFTLSGTKTVVDARSGANIVRQLDITARQHLDDSVTGSFVLLDSIDGTATCQQDGTLDAAFVYQHSGTENFNGLYAVEYIDRANLLNGQPKQYSGMLQLQFGATDVAVYDRHPDASVVSNHFDPATGVFEVITLREEVEDWNLDGTDDLVRETATLNGIMVRAVDDASGATLVFNRRIDEAIYLSTTVYDPAESASGVMEERQEGYGRFLASSGFNQTLTRANPDGSLAMVDRIGLNNPELMVVTSQSTLRFEAYTGTDTSVAPLCSADFETNMVLVENYPQADMSNEALRPNEYGYVACEAGAAGTLISGNPYTLVIRDDQGTPLDTSDDPIVYSLPTTYTAVATDAAQSTIPDRSDLRLDNAAPSQTDISQHITIDGYINPLAEHTLSWADMGADEYRLRFWQYNPALGMQGHHEVRVSSTTNSVTVPAGVFGIDEYTAIELSARFDNTITGTSAWSSSRHLVVHSEISGLFNAELTSSISGESVYFQFAGQRNRRGAFLCNIIHSSVSLACESFQFLVDPSTNTIGLSLRDTSGQLTGTIDEAMSLSLQFADARSATASIGDYVGSAELVTTELVALTQMAADGAQGTVFQLQNPLPLFESGQLDSTSGVVDLDGLGATLLTLWDDSDADTSNDFSSMSQPFWVGDESDATPPSVVNEISFDSAVAVAGSHVLPSGDYVTNVRNQLALGAQDKQYQVSYTAADASGVQAPLRDAMTVNGVTAGVGSGDAIATAINIAAQPAFNLDWISAVADTNSWTIVVRQVDVDGSITGTVGAAISGAEWRTTAMQAASDPALSTSAGAWTWLNDGRLDMVQRLQTGDVVQVQLVASDFANSIQGLSEPVFLLLGP